VTITGRIYRKIMLPPGVDASQVSAHYRDGVLELKVTSEHQPRRVEINFSK
jgi:HSP20 family molecular chaperone IbpA